MKENEEENSDYLPVEVEQPVSKGNLFADPTITKVIKEGVKGLYSEIPTAIRNVKKELKTKGRGISDRKLRYTVSKDLLLGSGLYGSPQSQSIFIQQNFNQNNFVVSPMLKEILDRHNTELTFDGEVVEDESVPQGKEKG